MTKKKNNAPFRLVNISTEQFATFKDNFEDGNYELDLSFNVNISASYEEQTVGIFTKYQFGQKGSPVLVLECGCHFELEESYWRDSIEGNVLTIKKEILTHMLVLTVGTSRGVLHAKKPKWLYSLLLPTLNVTSIIQGDMSFDLAAEEEE